MEVQGIYLGLMLNACSLLVINPRAISHSQVINVIIRQTFKNSISVLVYIFLYLDGIFIIGVWRVLLGI